MALSPHWLDDVIGDERDPAAIAEGIAKSPQFLRIVRIGVDQARLAEDQNAGARNVGTTFRQIIRETIRKGVQDAKGDVPADV